MPGGAAGLDGAGLAGRRVVVDVHGERAVGHRDPDPGARAGRVPDHVGQRLLDDPVRGQADRLRHRAEIPDGGGDVEFGPHPGLRDGGEQARQVVQARLRGLVGLAVGGPQHPEQAAHLGERSARGGGDLPELGDGGLGQALDPVRGAVGLDGDHRHVVGDHVVQLPGDPGAFLQQGAPGPLGLGDLLLGGEQPLRLAAAAQAPAEQ